MGSLVQGQNLPSLDEGLYHDSSYPLNDEHQIVWQLSGAALEDSDISRIWARLFDRGINLGPALGMELILNNGKLNVRYFAYGRIEQEVGNDDNNRPLNPNKIGVAFDSRGVCGSDCGL